MYDAVIRREWTKGMGARGKNQKPRPRQSGGIVGALGCDPSKALYTLAPVFRCI